MNHSAVHDVMPFVGRFPSWEAFDVARQAHCEKTLTMYVCRNTVKVAVANKRRKLQVPDNWVYDRKVYVCTHGYKRVSRSSGSRPRQHVRYTDCKARFTACVVSEQSDNGRATLLIKITGQHVVHSDHPVGLEQWRMYSQNRAAVQEHPYLTHEAELMRRVGSNKKAARAHIEYLSGKVCTMKDMHNLYARLKKRESAVRSVEAERGQSQRAFNAADMEAAHSRAQQPDGSRDVRVESVLQRFVNADVENHASILSGDDGSNEAICVASRAMKEHFRVFPELLLLDLSVTKLVDGHTRQHLHGFLSMDALGNTKPIFVALSLTTTPALLHRICQDFKRTHPTWGSIRKLVMGKLLPEFVLVLTQEFPRVEILLCQFQVLQAFDEVLLHSLQRGRTQSLPQDRLDGNTLDQEEVRQLLHQLVFARSELRYTKTKALLVQKLSVANSHDLLAELDGKWESNRSLWASYARAEEMEFSSFYTKGMASFWKPITGAFQRSGNCCFAAATIPQSSMLAMGSHTQSTMISFGPVDAVANNPTNALPANDANTITLAMTHGDATAARGDPLLKSVIEVLSTLRFIGDEWTSKMLILELTKPVVSRRCDPLLHFMINCLSSFAVDLICSQLTAQSNGSVVITKSRAPRTKESGSGSEEKEEPTFALSSRNEVTVRWINKMTREKHILQHDGSVCDCEFFALYHLPCRHLIQYEVSVLQHKQLSMAAVGPRWFLRSFQTPKLASQRESNELEYHLL